MASSGAVWGIDIGQCALKAIKVRPAGEDQMEVVAFDLIEHPKILSQPDADPDELIRAAIEKFASRNEWQRDKIVLGVPGQQTFARFAKLPPVEKVKQIAEIVKYEAEQQIPFDMEDVVWDYEVFASEDSPDIEVGIFAMRKDLVRKQIEFFSASRMQPSIIQTLPSALYNYGYYEHKPSTEGHATVIIDVGAQNTDLIIIEENSAWMRNIPLGGNNFTEALVKAFKLSFAKAESLKRTAASSKYARQIFQAMRPVFSELVSEVQRSLGYYGSTHRDIELEKLVALGNAFQLPGLQKYIEQNLQFSDGVIKPDKFATLTPSATINAPQFTENLLSFGAAYGLALQGLGEAKIKASLLPTELARVAVWKRKVPFWVATAACLGLAAFAPWARGIADAKALDPDSHPQIRTQVASILQKAQELASEYNEVSQDTGTEMAKLEALKSLNSNALIIPDLLDLVHEALPEVDPDVAAARTPRQFEQGLKSGKIPPRNQRKQIFIDSFLVTYSPDISTLDKSQARKRDIGAGQQPETTNNRSDDQAESTGGGTGGPGFYVHLTGRLTYGKNRADALRVLTQEFQERLRNFGRRKDNKLGFFVLVDEPGAPAKFNETPAMVSLSEGNSSSAPTGPFGARPRNTSISNEPKKDPITGEPMSGDWLFEFGFRVQLGDMPAETDESSAPTDQPGNDAY